MYIDSNEFWLFDGIDCLENKTTAQLADMISFVSSEIDEYCNTRFEPSADSYYLDLCTMFYTRRQPLLDVSSLSLNGLPLTADADYFVYPDSSKVVTASLVSQSVNKALEIHYLYGYYAVPATVKQVVVDLMKLDAESKASLYNGMLSESWDSEYAYTRASSKDLIPSELRKSILSRLDVFKVSPFAEPNNSRFVKARLL